MSIVESFCCHVCWEEYETSSALSEHLKVHPKCQCGQYFVPKIFKEHSMKCFKAETILKRIKINSDCQACVMHVGRSVRHWKA